LNYLTGQELKDAQKAIENIASNADKTLCKGTARNIPPTNFTDGDGDSRAEGQAAHFIIETYYVNAYAGGVAEYSIPKSSAAGNVGYADIVNLNTGEIFEIKSVQGKRYGNEEVERYVMNAGIHCSKAINWQRGKKFPKKIELPWITPNRRMTVYLDNDYPEGGVITYKLVEVLPKYPLPTVVPESDWEKIKELLKNMALNMESANQIATDFVKNNPKLCATLIVLGIAEITTGVVTEILSLGASSVPSVALAASGAILITVALNAQ
jgi:hypothetical protein